MRIGPVLLMAAAFGHVAVAQPKGAPPKKGGAHVANAPQKNLEPMIAELNGTDLEIAAKAALNLGLEEAPAAHDALLDALAWGLAPQVATEALNAIALHPAPPDVAALVRYAGHHNPNVRGVAIASLAAYPAPEAHAAIVLALHDQLPAVRAAAAQAAGRAKVKTAIEPMLALLERGEESAARGLGAMADADLARRIADELGKAPDPTLALSLGTILKRPDFGPDPARVEVVRAIGKIQDKAAVTELSDYVEATPKNPPRPSRQEAEGIVNARLGGGK